MRPTPAIEELSIYITAAKLNPTLLTPEFLVCSGITAEDWELACSPTVNERLSRVSFTNGVTLSVEFSSITFSESLKNKCFSSIHIPRIALIYTQILPNADYQELSIDPLLFFTLGEEVEGDFSHYVYSQLLHSGSWKNLGQKSLRATLNLGYVLEQGKFNLKIDDVLLTTADELPESAVMFSDNFPYEISRDTLEKQQQSISQLVNNWRRDLESFQEIVYEHFVKKV